MIFWVSLSYQTVAKMQQLLPGVKKLDETTAADCLIIIYIYLQLLIRSTLTLLLLKPWDLVVVTDMPALHSGRAQQSTLCTSPENTAGPFSKK